MPELPEVETVRRGLEPAITGRKISMVELRSKGLRAPFPPGLKRDLEGRKVVPCGRRAKYLLLTLDNGHTLVLHLGMSGRIFISPPGHRHEVQKHDHMILSFDNGLQLVFNDPRRFGSVSLIKGPPEEDKVFSRLGPEPLDKGFTGKKLATGLRGRKTSLKAALMDQRIVAGLGNIYVCEALFRSGLSPDRKAGSVEGGMAGKLVTAIRAVLNDALDAGGSSLKDYRKADGELGGFQHRFKVYDREGKACPGCTCNINKTGGIVRKVQGGRSTFYCPRKQK